MNIVVCGKNGQLARELQQTAPKKHHVEFLDREALDVGDAERVAAVMAHHKPDVIINATAYTAVDKAESDREEAYRVNESGPAHLAQAAKSHDAYLLHISTDFVFDGKHYKPYLPSDNTSPLGVYGSSKLAGEEQIRRYHADKSAIVRTAWVYSAFGNNFVKTMLRLMADKPELGIVADQIGTPTWAKTLAEVCWLTIEQQPSGCFHWTDAGAASWYDFAVAIQELALERGLLKQAIPIKPIAAASYPTPAERPHYSVLDKSSLVDAVPGITPVHWRKNVSNMLAEL